MNSQHNFNIIAKIIVDGVIRYENYTIRSVITISNRGHDRRILPCKRTCYSSCIALSKYGVCERLFICDIRCTGNSDLNICCICFYHGKLC